MINRFRMVWRTDDDMVHVTNMFGSQKCVWFASAKDDFIHQSATLSSGCDCDWKIIAEFVIKLDFIATVRRINEMNKKTHSDGWICDLEIAHKFVHSVE